MKTARMVFAVMLALGSLLERRRVMKTARRPSVALLALAALFLWGAGGIWGGASAAAATQTWNSSSNGNWTTSGSWSPTGTPTSGTAAVVSNGHVVTVNTPGQNAASIEVGGTAGSGLSIVYDNSASTLTETFGALTLATGTTSTVHNNGTLTVGTNGTLNLSASTLTIESGGVFNIAGAGASSAGAIRSASGASIINGSVALTADSSIGVTAGTLTVTGGLSGSCNLTKVGAGTLILGDNNSAYTGVMTVGGGILRVTGSSALGTTGTGAASVAVADVRANYVPGVATPNAIADTLGNGTWAYRRGDGGILAWNTSGYYVNSNTSLSLHRGDTAVLPAGATEVSFEPGATTAAGDSVPRWTAGASETGTIELKGNIRKLNTYSGTGANGVYFTIRKNGSTVLYGAQYVAYGDTTGYAFDVTTTVSAGDYVDFVLNSNGDSAGDGSGLAATIVSKSLATNSGTAIISGGALELVKTTSDITTSEPLSVAGTGVSNAGVIHNISGNNTLNGAITLTAASAIGVDSGTTLAVGGAISGTSFGLTKVGDGTLVLGNGTNSYSGATTVSAGTLKVNGSISSSTGISVGAGVLAGNGVVPVISGYGLVSPGNSPGILTTTQVNPTGGLDFAFQFTAAGSPDYDSPSASLNDVLRITDGTSPFTAPLSLVNGNVVGIYFDVVTLYDGVYKGAWYTDKNSSFLGSVQGATYNYFVLGDGLGGDGYLNGVGYYSLADYRTIQGITSAEVVLSTLSEPADFGTGTVNGWVTQFTVTNAFAPAGGAVPEPAALGLIGLTLLAIRRRRASR